MSKSTEKLNSLVSWFYCEDPNVINDLICNATNRHRFGCEGLSSADRIISITWDGNHGSYVVFFEYTTLATLKKVCPNCGYAAYGRVPYRCPGCGKELL